MTSSFKNYNLLHPKFITFVFRVCMWKCQHWVFLNTQHNKYARLKTIKKSPVLYFIPRIMMKMQWFVNVGPNRLWILKRNEENSKMGVRQINYFTSELTRKKIDYVNSNRTTNPKNRQFLPHKQLLSVSKTIKFAKLCRTKCIFTLSSIEISISPIFVSDMYTPNWKKFSTFNKSTNNRF